MHNHSRGFKERVIRVLARASLVLTLTLLGAMFMSTAASAAAPVAQAAAGQAGGPSAAGIVLAVLVVGVGVGILAYGALRSAPHGDQRRRIDAHLADHHAPEGRRGVAV